MKTIDYRDGRLSIVAHSIKSRDTGEATDLDAEDLLAAAFDKYARNDNEEAVALAAMSQALAALETRDLTRGLISGLAKVEQVDGIEPPVYVRIGEPEDNPVRVIHAPDPVDTPAVMPLPALSGYEI